MKDSNTLAGNATNKLLIKGNPVTHKRQLHEGIKYPCGNCGKQFAEKGTLAKHERIVYPCGHCGKQLTEKETIDKHKRAVHEGLKYPCGQCGQQFSLKK